MTKDETIEINLKFFKKYLLKNGYVFGFSIFALIIFLSYLIVSLNISIGNLTSSYYFIFFRIFPSWFFIFLTVMFVFSAVLAYHEKHFLMFLPILFWLLISSAYIRTQNIPQLKDITTNDWTLGPDLDPFLYLRIAQDINNGNYQKIDYMRRAPLGVDNYANTNLMPWAIVVVFKISKIFGNDSLTFAAIIAPVIFSILASIFFFLFVYALFSFKFSKKESALGATIATAFYVFSVQMLHRTTAGIPEIESLGMVWFWLAFLFFVMAWKQNFDDKKQRKKIIVYSFLSALFTGLMIWTWGGYNYIFLVLSATSFLAFLVNKDFKKNFLVYSMWFLFSVLFLFLKIKDGIFLSITAFVFPSFVMLVLLINLLFFNYLDKFKILKRFNLPTNIKLFFLIITLAFLFLFFFDLKLLAFLISKILEQIIYPFVGTGRLGPTVAENQQIYLVEAMNSLGKLYFWFFLVSIISIFFYFTASLDKKERFSLRFYFLIFVFGLLFSRYSQNSLLNGVNSLSKFVFFGSILLFLFMFFYMYVKSYNKNQESFKKFSELSFVLLFLFSLFLWTALSIRGSVRLLFLVSPFTIVFISFLPTIFFDVSTKLKDSFSSKFFKFVSFIIIIIFFSIIIQSATQISQSAKATVPSSYNQQWQKAMAWVRENTPENSIFVHWWDYGYWIQTLGKRATVTDGGHAGGDSAIHFIGRYVLTTPKNESAYSFMKSWNVSYLLIDPTELGKYPAYSRIGSNDSWDRISTIPVGEVNRAQIIERVNETTRVYSLFSYVDDDIIYKSNNGDFFLPGASFDKIGNPQPKSFIVGVVLTELRSQNLTFSLKQPEGIFVYNNKQYRIPLRYLYINNQLIDFKEGINSTFVIIPSAYESGNGLKLDPLGGAIYLSEKTGSSLLARLYIMNNTFKDYNNFNLAHSEDDFFVSLLKQQGFDMGDFVYYQGLRGPIKIWKVEYPENTKTYSEFLDYKYVPGILDKYFYQNEIKK